MTQEMFCAVDPGREKFGVAFGFPDELVYAAIVPAERTCTALGCAASGNWEPLSEWSTEGRPPTGCAISRIFLGDGTSHEKYAELMREYYIVPSLVREHMTTLEARDLYWRLHPPSGIFRLIPLALRTPPRSIDDMAAWAIMKRAVSVIL
jgi:hypothetical protein